MAVSRRDFLKYGVGGLVVGSQLSWLLENKAYAATQTLDFTITDAMKQMVTYNQVNTSAQCYFWIYKSNTPNLPAEVPGPHIFCTEGDTITITLTNELDEPHGFKVQGVANTNPGKIQPGKKKTITFTAPAAGSYLYYDPFNEPVNRVMGLHGAFIVMPAAKVAGHNWTPYSNPTPAVQQMYDTFGKHPYPGLAWEEGDPATNTPPFRQYIWLLHQASPVLFAEVGNYTAGLDYPAAQFADLFINDPYANTFTSGIWNKKAQYFTINGQSGHFSHNNPAICPQHRVGEPALVRILNAGLWMHSLHIHANHVWVTYEDGVVQKNPLWVDTWTAAPMGRFDYTIPFMRPPDVPNVRGIGRPDTPLTCLANPKIPGSTPHETWPPIEHLNMFYPAQNTPADPLHPLGDPLFVNIGVQMSPLCYPMHDHAEPSQTAQGGNYNNGLINGIEFIGDRNHPGGVITFPGAPTDHGPSSTGPAAPPF
jgi:FtsP/CotA-like multicopper oxidase with cupredoxin domain